MGPSQLKVVFGLIFVALLHSVVSQEKERYRLSNDTRPVYYDVVLVTRIDLGETNFDGTVKIEIVPQQQTKTIEINHRRLTIDEKSVRLVNQANQLIGVTKVDLKSQKEIVIITTETELDVGNTYHLSLSYSGTLRDDNAGFYRSYYRGSDNKEKWLATTQFETTDARHAFPCYDEPALKARFDITIKHGKSYHATSNMPVQSRVENGDLATTKFATTESMSTYLLAFVVSDFEYLQTRINGRLESVYSKPNDTENALLALNIGKKVLKGFENYLNVEYNLPKMDQFAIPDFAAGAMENWGLVTYREEMLLFTEGVSTTATKTKISNTIAHEFAHQWFGDLVSPEWWEYTWLNEGFATLFAYIGTNMVYPSWKIDDYFMVQEYQNALSFDGTKQTRPMTHYVEVPNDIAAVFDTISYSKAGSVLRMIQKAIGDENFKNGLTKYLNSRKQASANEDDLFTALEAEVPKENKLKTVFVKFAKSWSNNAGVPIVNADRNYGKEDVNLTQTQYEAEEGKDKEKKTWYIPINFVTPSTKSTDTLPEIVLEDSLVVQKVGGLRDSDWLLLNKENTGYYRVNYDKTNWNMLAKQLQKDHSQIHQYQRAQLIDDAFALALIGKLEFSVALNITKYVEREHEYVPWAAATSVFEKLNNMLDGTGSDYKNFTFFVGQMTANKFGDLSFTPKESDSHLDTFTRKLIVDWACRADVNSCLKKANELLNKQDSIDPDAREIIYCNGLRNGKDKEFDFVLKKLEAEKDAAVRRELMSVLGCVLEDKLLKNYMDEVFATKNKYRKQEVLNILPAVYSRSNPGITAAIDWLTKNWDAYSKIESSFTKTNPLVAALRGIAARIYNKKQKLEFGKLASNLNGTVYQNDFEKAQKTIDENVKWAEEHRTLVTGWFIDYWQQKQAKGSAAFILPSITLIFTLIISVFICQT